MRWLNRFFAFGSVGISSMQEAIDAWKFAKISLSFKAARSKFVGCDDFTRGLNVLLQSVLKVDLISR